MVMNAAEAEALIATRDRTGRLLVVAFPGSLSPAGPRRGADDRRAARSGRILNVDAVVWQDWAVNTAGTWRQDPALSGGGFLFDTGAHMLNTVADLAGEESPRSPPGSRTTAARSTSGAWSWPASPPARW